MGVSRYPRPGYSIAPKLLHDILTFPVRGNGLRGIPQGLRLCDLDATVWMAVDYETAIRLSDEVVRIVARALAGKPRALLDRFLPAVPTGKVLSDLEIQRRTYNCLSREGFSRRPQELANLTISQVLDIRGFGVRSLVDLLTSIESIGMEKPSSRAVKRAPIHAQRGPSRYPRPGHALVPETLRGFLTGLVPASLSDGFAYKKPRLSDLDSSVWSFLKPQVIGKLAKMAVRDVNSALVSNLTGRYAVFLQTAIPWPLHGIRLADLELSTRTRNCLRKAGFEDSPDRLRSCTIGDLLNIHSFGAKCLLDFLTSMEASVRNGAPNAETPDTRGLSLTKEARLLKKMKAVLDVPRSDPRLGFVFRLAPEAGSIRSLVDAIIYRKDDPVDPGRVAHGIRSFREHVRQLSRKRVNEEFLEILVQRGEHGSKPMSRRNLEMVEAFYGIGSDKQRCTLTELGHRYRITKEAVRQICMLPKRIGDPSNVFAPVLDRALCLVRDRVPARVEDVEAALVEAGLTHSGMRITSLEAIARVLGREPVFSVVEHKGVSLVMSSRAQDDAKKLLALARRLVSHDGVTTIEEVACRFHGKSSAPWNVTSIAVVLKALSNLQWLDEQGGWFYLGSDHRNRLLNSIWKVLAVARRIHVSELRSAVRRPYRMAGFAPPTRVLLALCRQCTFCTVEDQTVAAKWYLDWGLALKGAERVMVRVIHEFGPLLMSRPFEDLCVAIGVSSGSFWQKLAYSPVIARYANGVYGLPGADLPPGLIDSLAVQKERASVLEDFGWGENGSLWMFYRLSGAAISRGILTIPAAVSQYVSGEFAANAEDGTKLADFTAVRNQLSGLGDLFRRCGVESGDCMLVTISPRDKSAIVVLGDEELLDMATSYRQRSQEGKEDQTPRTAGDSL